MTARVYAGCPFRYTTARNARRKAWDLADRAGTKPLPPVHCDDCGGWHLAATRPDTTDTTKESR